MTMVHEIGLFLGFQCSKHLLCINGTHPSHSQSHTISNHSTLWFWGIFLAFLFSSSIYGKKMLEKDCSIPRPFPEWEGLIFVKCFMLALSTCALMTIGNFTFRLLTISCCILELAVAVTAIDQVEFAKMLGVTLDSHLTWACHIDNICSFISCRGNCSKTLLLRILYLQKRAAHILLNADFSTPVFLFFKLKWIPVFDLI